MDPCEEEKEVGDSLIEIRDLKITYYYGEPFSVKHVCFERGKITTIIGRNGCGKTTFLRTIAGLMDYKGSILIDKKECNEYRRLERAKKVSYLPQMIKPVCMNVETLAEHGRFPWQGNFRRLSRRDREQVDAALSLTNMEQFKERELTELSGGELRRAYLSMIVAQDADMMLLDEPTTYMDIESQELFFKIIRILAHEGHGIVMTCHNIEQSFSYSDHIVIMEDREVKKAGSPEELSHEEKLLRKIFGATIKKVDNEELLYPYILAK